MSNMTATSAVEIVKRDGTVLEVVKADDNALAVIHRAFGGSASHAVLYEGYRVEEIGAEVVESEFSAPDSFPEGSRSWTVRLSYEGRTVETPFFTGPGIKSEPTAREVLECLCLDYVGPESVFEDWAEELGFNPDSRKDEETFRAILQQSAILRRFLGDDLDAIREGLGS